MDNNVHFCTFVIRNNTQTATVSATDTLIEVYIRNDAWIAVNPATRFATWIIPSGMRKVMEDVKC